MATAEASGSFEPVIDFGHSGKRLTTDSKICGGKDSASPGEVPKKADTNKKALVDSIFFNKNKKEFIFFIKSNFSINQSKYRHPMVF